MYPEVLLSKYEAVLFDLDGVLTKTALVHEAAWKLTFDEYLATVGQAEFKASDYAKFVDGKPRIDGVVSMLQSRGISPDDATVNRIAKDKNIAFVSVLRSEGVEAYPDAIKLLDALAAVAIPTGVVSSSANCLEVIEAAGIAEKFPVRVDGVIASQKGLRGKPQPDMFVEAANELNADPSQIVVIEDAISGVAAASAGKFGLVIGVARKHNEAELLANGANIVLTDLTDLLPIN